ncbi:MAG: hypothetical protein WC718_14835 [Phycisphaerales bacterium]|jgi:hypothetical protein
MRVVNVSGEASNFDPGGVFAPRLFYGPVAPGTEHIFVDAPLLSLYWDVVAGVLYAKTVHTPAAADWKAIVTTGGGQTIAGALTVTGTLTAADLVAS